MKEIYQVLSEKVRKLEKIVSSQDKLIKNQEELLENYREIFEPQRKLIEEQAKLIESLQNELRKYSNENTPSSAIPSFNKENTHHRHQRPGQKEGHEGTSRPMPDHIDETKDATMDQCPDCGGIVSDVGERQRVIETIIPAKVHVKMINVHRYWCPCCGKIVDAPVTDAFPNCRFGLEIYLLVALMRYRIGITYEKIEDLLQISYRLDLSRGELPQMMDRLANEFGDQYDSLIQELRRSPHVNPDETGWRIDGRGGWLWAFINEKIALYTITKGRGRNVPKRILGKNYDGVVGCDFWSAYNGYKNQQRCHGHLRRNLRETAKKKGDNSDFFAFKKKLKRILNDSIRIWELEKDKTVLIEQKRRLEERISLLCLQSWEDTDCKRLVKRLKRHKEHLFTFLLHEGVEPHNNIAERGIRPAVVMRKNCYGNRSVNGADTTSVMLTMTQTCRKRDQNFLDWGKDHLENRLTPITSFR
ncbi:MAG: IS66 family transposase [Ktedonobacteraceae bacterium]